MEGMLSKLQELDDKTVLPNNFLFICIILQPSYQRSRDGVLITNGVCDNIMRQAISDLVDTIICCRA